MFRKAFPHSAKALPALRLPTYPGAAARLRNGEIVRSSARRADAAANDRSAPSRRPISAETDSLVASPRTRRNLPGDDGTGGTGAYASSRQLPIIDLAAIRALGAAHTAEPRALAI
jgi:hypothetical protein